MDLLQGGVQSGLKGFGEYAITISELGFSLYKVDSNQAVGFCSLANTVSASISNSTIYVSNLTEVFSIPITSVSGDSSTSLVTTGIVSTFNIIDISAQDKFIALATTDGITLINLQTNTSRSLSIAVKFIDTHKDFLAFCTDTSIYTFCIDSDTFALTHCYSPMMVDFTGGFIQSRTNTPEIDCFCDNFIVDRFLEAPFAAKFMFGEYENARAGHRYQTYFGTCRLWGWGVYNAIIYFGLDGVRRVIPSINTDFPSYTMDNLLYKKLAWSYNLNEGYSLDIVKPVSQLSVERDPSLTYVFNLGVHYHDIYCADRDPDSIFRVTEYTEDSGDTEWFFTIPDQPKGTFNRAADFGSIVTENKVYSWGLIMTQGENDDPDTFLVPRLLFMTFDKQLKTCTCVDDTLRTIPTSLLEHKNDTLQRHKYFSATYAIGDNYLIFDKMYDSAEWASSGKSRQLILFSIDDTTDTITVLSTTDVVTGVELFTATIICGDQQVFLSYDEDFPAQDFPAQDFPAQVFIPAVQSPKVFNSITAINLKAGLLFAESGVGLHYSGITGYWPKLHQEVDQVIAMDITGSGAGDATIAYSTASKVIVVDI